MILFETERLRVRYFTENDRDHFFRLSGNEEVMRYIRAVSTREESDAFLDENIRAYAAFPNRGRWAVEERDSHIFAGSFALIPVPWNDALMQLGYSLLPENWGKGYATELTRAGLQYFFRTDPADEIYGVTEMPNVPSQKVLLKAGFVPVEKRWEGEKELQLFIARRTGPGISG